MSLVITIIVMLILAGVVLSLTLGNNGIFKTAKMAAENYTNAQEKEIEDLDKFLNEMLVASNEYGNGSGEDKKEENSTTQTVTKEEYDKVVLALDKLLDIHEKDVEDLRTQNESLVTKVQTLENSSLTLDKMYPVGAIYTSVDSKNPGEIFGGTWESYGVGRTIVGAGDGYTVGSTGGNKTIQLTEANLPSHSHSIPALTGTAQTTNIRGDIWTWSNSGNINSGVFTKSDVQSTISYNEGGTGRLYGYWFRMTANHSHNVTTNASTTGNKGSGTAINVQDPYIVTYMWKRIL